MPVPSSYSRVQDGIWSGGTYIHYGSENRESPIRICNPHSAPGTSRNFEIKCIDGLSNPYLSLAGILGVGARGIQEGTKLDVRDVGEWEGRTAAQMNDDERKARGIVGRMPRDIVEARAAMRAGEVLRSVLGDRMVDSILNVNETLEKVMSTGQGGEEDLRMLVEHY
jgi:glutamine synthetase